MNAWEESVAMELKLRGLTGEQIAALARDHRPTFKPGTYVTKWTKKSDKDIAWNISAYERGMLLTIELYHMCRPWAVADEDPVSVMRLLRGTQRAKRDHTRRDQELDPLGVLDPDE